MERLASCKDSDEIMMAFPRRTENCTKYFRICPYHDFCLTWSNPLQHCFEPPIGFEIDFWNPSTREETASKVSSCHKCNPTTWRPVRKSKYYYRCVNCNSVVTHILEKIKEKEETNELGHQSGSK